MEIPPEIRERLETVFSVTQTIFHWGFVPFVLYLGFSKGADPGMPPISLRNLVWQ